MNMPAESTKRDFMDAVIYAWKNGLKGITLYRTGSREDEVLTLAKETAQEKTKRMSDTCKRMPFFDEKTQEWRWLPKRPDILPTYGLKKMRSGCGDLLIDISEMEGRPYECLGDYTLGGGGCDAMLRTTRVLLGLCFRWGVPTWDIVKNLKAIKCDVARENTGVVRPTVFRVQIVLVVISKKTFLTIWRNLLIHSRMVTRRNSSKRLGSHLAHNH